jgi:hypothetical protein
MKKERQKNLPLFFVSRVDFGLFPLYQNPHHICQFSLPPIYVGFENFALPHTGVFFE